MGPTLNFKHTTLDCTIYQTTFKGHNIVLLRIVADCLIQCENEATAKKIFLIIGLVLQLKNEDTHPLAYLGPCVDFNDVDIEESNTHIIISCQSYIERMLRVHAWDTPKNKHTKNPSPLPDSHLKTIF